MKHFYIDKYYSWTTVTCKALNLRLYNNVLRIEYRTPKSKIHIAHNNKGHKIFLISNNFNFALGNFSSYLYRENHENN